jgi:hypothetical protein
VLGDGRSSLLIVLRTPGASVVQSPSASLPVRSSCESAAESGTVAAHNNAAVSPLQIGRITPGLVKQPGSKAFSRLCSAGGALMLIQHKRVVVTVLGPRAMRYLLEIDELPIRHVRIVESEKVTNSR